MATILFLKEKAQSLPSQKSSQLQTLNRGKIHFFQYCPSHTTESETSIEQSVLQHLTHLQRKGFLYRKLCQKTLLAKLRTLSGLDTLSVGCSAQSKASAVILQSFQMLPKLLHLACRLKLCEIRYILQPTIISHQHHPIDLGKKKKKSQVLSCCS